MPDPRTQSARYRRPTYRLLRVQDPELLKTVVAGLVGRLGSQLVAADALGLTQAHVSRLVSGRIGKMMHRGTVEALREQLGPTEREQLDRAVLGDMAMLRLDLYQQWLERELARYADYHVDLERLVRRLEQNDEAVQRFQSRLLKRGHTPERIRLAFLRCLEPFLEAPLETWLVERGIQELGDSGELTAYLRAALRREEILLTREPDMQRAQAKTEVDFTRAAPVMRIMAKVPGFVRRQRRKAAQRSRSRRK